MFVQRIQPKEFISPITKKVLSNSNKAAKKLNDVALTPWEFEKMINEPKANVVKKHASTSGGSVCSEAYFAEAPDLYSC